MNAYDISSSLTVTSSGRMSASRLGSCRLASSSSRTVAAPPKGGWPSKPSGTVSCKPFSNVNVAAVSESGMIPNKLQIKMATRITRFYASSDRLAILHAVDWSMRSWSVAPL